MKHCLLMRLFSSLDERPLHTGLMSMSRSCEWYVSLGWSHHHLGLQITVKPQL